MNPINFPFANKVLHAPEGMENCIPLPVHNDGHVTTSCWEFSEDEIAMITEHRRMYLAVFAGESQPPVQLMAELPSHDPKLTMPWSRGLQTQLELDLFTAIDACQCILAAYIEPGNSVYEIQTINKLLNVLDDRKLVETMNRFKVK